RNPGGDRGGRPAAAQPCPANPESPPGPGLRRCAGRTPPRADPEGAGVRAHGGRRAPRAANPRRGRRDTRRDRRTADDPGRGPAGARASGTARRESVTAALAHVFVGERKLLVLDGYADVEEPIVDALAGFVRSPRGRGKLLVLAQESTPAYCRFYSKADVDAGLVAERHLRGLDVEGCRAMLGRPAIDAEALRRVYL